jgi:hypothetical protein
VSGVVVVFLHEGMHLVSHVDVAGLETCHRANVLANKFDAFLCHCFWAVAIDMLSFDGDEGHWNFSLDLIMGSNHDGLRYFVVFHQNFLHLSS